ncbi:MAG TPA: hypothetical protein VFR59_10780, partial [Steroidobacteraceae bacterium]|nr:hypothetical protein [Steroidobacteraceae bacterium]
MRLRSFTTVAALLGTATIPIASLAQTPPPDDEGRVLENVEVAVYAERKASAQNLREVPMAVSAINGDLIEEGKLLSVVDVGRLAPNTQLDPVGTFPG